MLHVSSLNFWFIHHNLEQILLSLYELLLLSASLERPTHWSLMKVIYLRRPFSSRAALSELALFWSPLFSLTNAVCRVLFNCAAVQGTLEIEFNSE